MQIFWFDALTSQGISESVFLSFGDDFFSLQRESRNGGICFSIAVGLDSSSFLEMINPFFT